MNLTFYPIAGMAIFLAVFVCVVVRVTGRVRRAEHDLAAMLPLSDDLPRDRRVHSPMLDAGLEPRP